MELKVLRQPSVDGHTIGELFIDDVYECFTCEDQIREVPGEAVSVWKVYGQTAIPAGRYRVTLDFSPHFNGMMPHVNDVPGFSGILIHIGNTSADTEGCLLLGKTKTPTGVGLSTLEFFAFLPKFHGGIEAGEVWITYVNPA